MASMIASFHELAQRLLAAIAEPFHGVLSDAASKLWWPVALVSLLAALVIYGPGPFAAKLLDRNTWTSRSAVNDYLILFINPVLQVTLLSGLALNYAVIGQAIAAALTWAGVHGQTTDNYAILAGLALTIVLFIADDFARWLTHYLQHRVPLLWEFHKVHHSAEVLNFFTVQRHHPLDPLFTTAVIGIVTALVNGLFIGVFGNHLTIATVAGANIFRIASNALGGLLRHSPFWLSFGAPTERWLVSPAMHHIHHSSDPKHYDTNFGTALSIWDRWAGTIYFAGAEPVTDFGVGEETERFQTLRAIYLRPLQRAWTARKPNAATEANR